MQRIQLGQLQVKQILTYHVKENAMSSLGRCVQLRSAKFMLFVLALSSFAATSSSLAFAQNSSLFHRPVANFAQSGSAAATAEVLPAPSKNGNSGQSNVAMQPSQNSGQQMYPAIQVQQGTFLGPTDNAGQLGLQSSWGYVPPTPARTLKLHDIVQIRIEEVSTSLATGSATSRKTTSYDATIKEWLRLVGLDTIKPAPQADGDPKIQTSQSEVYRGDSNLRTSESYTRNIAAEIVDIKPNGHIVLDATKEILEDDNSVLYSLTGTCRSQDIGPDNVVLSRNLIRSKINRQSMGHVRDGYSRGWLTKLLARVKPF